MDSWGIRNSSTMNFSTIVERVVAPKLVRDEQSKKNAATFPQFFSRFPRLYPFLLQKFQEQITLSEKVPFSFFFFLNTILQFVFIFK